MKKMKYGIAVTCLTVGMMLAITACGGKKAESTETAAQTAVVVETQTETETETAQESELTLADGQMFSYLTGEPVDKKIGLQRPYAIMINNIKEGLPQSGVSQAEMIYEAQVEGGITRLMALFQDVDHVEKIGSIRSARHYILILPMIMMRFMFITASPSMLFRVLKMRISLQSAACPVMNHRFSIAQQTEKHRIMFIQPGKC